MPLGIPIKKIIRQEICSIKYPPNVKETIWPADQPIGNDLQPGDLAGADVGDDRADVRDIANRRAVYLEDHVLDV